MLALEFDEAVVAASISVGIVAANLRAAFVNRAASIRLIEEHAHRFIDVVFAMAQHTNRLIFVSHFAGKLLLRDLDTQTVMLGQALDITRFGFDVVVAATIARTLAAIVSNFLSHGLP